MEATIKDIAKETGLGLATISSYLNGGNVREKNRVLIEKAIKELNYQRNEVARGLKTNRSKVIGIIIPELKNIFFTEIIQVIEDILRARGYVIMVCDCRSDLLREKEAMELLLKRRVDGLIIIPTSSSETNVDIFLQSGKPVLALDRKLESDCDCILVDNKSLVYEATKGLIRYGHKQIGFIGGPSDNSSAVERREGYELAIKENHLPIKKELIQICDYTIRGGMIAMEELLHNCGEMDAVIISNYESTIGGMIVLHEKGVNIPEDISVIGYDNEEFANATRPKLDVLIQPMKELGIAAAEGILYRLNEMKQQEEQRGSKKIILTGTYMKGASVRRF